MSENGIMINEELPKFLQRQPKIRVAVSDVSIGADPELFIFSRATMLPVSVHNILPGTKHKPYPVPRGSIQVDGTAAEFNINPASTRESFLQNIKEVQRVLCLKLNEKHKDLFIKYTPIVEYTKRYFKQIPEEAKRLGCEPDWNAYKGEMNPPPSVEDQESPVRSAGGHVHIGFMEGQDKVKPFEQEHFDVCCGLTKELDFTLYNSSLLWDHDEIRRTIYGKPGAFRPKQYGMEYRVLSNMWLREVKYQQFVYDTTKAVSMKYLKGDEISSKFRPRFDLRNPSEYGEYCNFLESQNVPSPRLFDIS